MPATTSGVFWGWIWDEPGHPHTMSFRLYGEGVDFDPPFAGANGDSALDFARSDILRAAILTGRTRSSAKRFGVQSRLETRWRLSAVQLALDLEPPLPGMGPKYFRRPPQWQRLDPSEKSALNFTLGGVIAKLVAERLLNTPLILHHDVYAPFLQTQLGRNDTRPDFAGWTTIPNSRWVAIEAKGRSRFPRASARTDAKTQAGALGRVRGQAVSCHVCCWSYESQGQVFAFYEDPPPNDEKGLILDLEPHQFGAAYYAPLRALLEVAELETRSDELTTYRVPSLDVKLMLHSKLDDVLRESASPVMERLMELLPMHNALASDFPLGPDGVAILPANILQGDTKGGPRRPGRK